MIMCTFEYVYISALKNNALTRYDEITGLIS